MKKRRKIVIFGVVAVIIGVAAFFGYRVIAGRAASAADLRTAAVTRGTVSTTISGSGNARARQSTTISWQTSGTVDTVGVQMGQVVSLGDELASLDPSTLSTGIIQAQADLIDAQNAYAELLEPDPLKIAQATIALEEAQEALDNLLNPTESAVAEAELAVINAQTVVDNAQAIVDRLDYPRASDETIASARAGYLLAQDKVDRMQTIYEDTPGDPETDAMKAQALANLESARTEMRRALGTLNWYLGTPTDDEIYEKQADLAVAQADLQAAQDKLDALRNPTEVNIALAQATLEDAQDALESAQNGASEDELIVAKTRVTLAEAELAKMSLTAPFSGTITSISTITGDIVNQGETAFRIDDMSSLYIDMSISEVDILQVKTGQPAVVLFDAISDREYAGEVVQIGLAASSSQGVVNYTVTVQITDPDSTILPGMTASVDLIVEEHADVLVVPSTALWTTGGQRTVTVLYQGEQISVPVTVGLSSNSLTEVTSDSLKEGDVVVLNTSTSSASSSQTTRQFDGGEMMIIEEGPSFQVQPGGGMMP